MSQAFATTRAWTAALVVAMAASALVAGCERNQSGTVPDEPSSVEKTTQPSAADKGDQPDQPEGVGQSCQTPKDCPSYLWCADQTCVVPASVSGEHDANTPKVTFFDANGDKLASFWVELALTRPEQEKGLMFRRSIGPEWGMLFVYPDERPLSFWMQNTFIPLDMVFIDGQGGVVNIIRQAEPLTRTRRRSRSPARYVLELAGGRADELGLQAGQRVELTHVADEHKPEQ